MAITPAIIGTDGSGSGGEITGTEIVQKLKSLQSPNKLPTSAIENAVTSVNSQTGSVTINPSSIGAQPASEHLTKLANATFDHEGMLWVNTDGSYGTFTPTDYTQSLMRLGSAESYRAMLNLGSFSTLDVDETGKIPVDMLSEDFSGVAYSGSYQDLLDKPEIPDVDYPVTSVNNKTGGVVLNASDVGAAGLEHTHTITDISGLQSILDNKLDNSSTISYASITGTPSLSAVATSGSYKDLIDKPTLFSGNYADLNNKPTLFDGNYNSLNNRPTLFDGTWISLTGKPGFKAVATSGDYNDLINKPVLFDGNYSSLTNKPTIPASQVNSDWNATSGVSQILNKPTLFNGTWTSLTGKPTFANVATSGSYVDLTNKPTIPTNTSQIVEGTNLYYTDARAVSAMSTAGYRKVETLQGTTNASGVYQVVFANTYTVPPHVNPVIINGTAAMMLTVTNITTTGCTVTVVQRSAVTLLAVEVLLAATTPVNGATIAVLVVPK